MNDKRISLGRNGKMLLTASVALGGVLASAGVLHAGYKEPATAWEVSISGSSTGSFAGALGSARASSDGLQYIGCEMIWNGPTASNTVSVVPSNYGYCYARDRAGNTRGCYITIKYNNAINIVSAVNQDSYLSVSYFTMPDSAYCGSVYVANYSHNPVKTN